MANPENERRFKNRFLVWLGETMGPFFLKLLYRPNKWVEEGAHHYEDALAQGKSVILASWHGTLLPVLMNLAGKGFYGIVGNHYPDAEIITRIGRKLGWNIIRGSSTDGGRKAYEGMMSILREGGKAVGITPDGPKGPAKIPKAGVIRAAQKTGAFVVPVSAQSTRHWGFTNWDTFYVAKPFGRIEIIYGEPLFFSLEDDFEVCSQKLAEALNRLDKEVTRRVAAEPSP